VVESVGAAPLPASSSLTWSARAVNPAGARPTGRPGALAGRRLSAISPTNIVAASVIFSAA